MLTKFCLLFYQNMLNECHMLNITQKPTGTAEYLPAEFVQFDALRNTLLGVYASFGYGRIETSILQYLEVLSSGGDISKEIYAITRAKAESGSDEDTRGLRFDLTKPLARYIGENQSRLTFPFKRTEVGLVFRGERPQKGRLRQFYQADFDVIGRGELSIDFDAEMIEVAAAAFEKINIAPFIIRFNNRKLMQAIMETVGIAAVAFPAGLSAVDKIEKIGATAVQDLLVADCAISQTAAMQLTALVSQQFTLDQVGSFLQGLDTTSEAMQIAVAEVATVVELLLGAVPLDSVVLDLSIARGLEYYTGTVFETNLIGYEKYGSVCSGGRYDDLASDFSKERFPGVGGSVGLSRLFAIMRDERLTFISDTASPEQIYLAIADDSRKPRSRILAKKLRADGYSVTISSGGKLKKQFENASKGDFDAVYILEEDGLVTVKNLKTREETRQSINF
jgi:histidyl-tRNA synthetase